MHLETFTYNLATRSWSVPALPHLDAPSTMVLAFGAPEMVAHPSVFQLLRDAYPNSSLIGCSSAGVIAGAEVRDRALSVVVAKFERTKLRTAAALVRDASGARAAGAGLARKLLGPRLRAVLVLAEGLRIDGDALVSGIRSVLGEEVVVAGGLAGDDVRFERTWVCLGNRLQSGLVAGVGFYGTDLIVGCGSESGWVRFGPERAVTRAEGNTLYELDGAPAASVYKRYLGERLAGLPAAGMLYPLALWPPEAHDAFAVRPLIAADSDSGALVFTGAVPEGHRSQLMRTDADRLLHSAVDAALASTRTAGLARRTGEPEVETPSVLGIAVSGMGRRMALGDRADEELKAARRALPPGAVTAGFYGYGEIAPGADGRCRLQHQSMTLLTLGEPGRAQPKQVPAGVPVRTASTADSGPQTLSRLSLSALGDQGEDFTATVSRPIDIGIDDEAPRTSGFAEVISFARDLDTGAWSVSPLPALDSPRTLVLVFASSDARAHPRAFADLRLSYPRSHIIGCSATGAILGAEARDRSMSVAVVRFAYTELASAQVALGTSRDGESAGRALARELARSDLRALLVFSSAPAIPGEAVVRGLRAGVGDDVVIAGGVAAGGARGEYSWILARGTLARQAVAAVGFYGDHVIVGHGASVGWDDIGPARSVTRSQGGVLLELDGRPALDWYQEALGASKGVPGHLPVALLDPDDTRRWRVVMGLDERQRSLTLAGGIPPDSRAQLVRSAAGRVAESAAEAAARAREAAGRTGPNALGLMLSNTLRHMTLGEGAAQELASASEALGAVRLVGCYARGAISSAERDESAVAITVLGESPSPRFGQASEPTVTTPDVAPKTAAGMPAPGDIGGDGQDDVTRTVSRLQDLREASGAAAVPVAVMAGTGTGSVSGSFEEPPGRFEVATFAYDAGARRWSVDELPALDSRRTLVLAFGAPELASTPEVFTELRQAYPRAHVLGCSTAGEIVGGHVRDHSLSVAVVRFCHTTLATASVVVGDAAGSFAAGQVLAHKLDEPGLRAVLVLAEGLEIAGSDLLRGIRSVLDDTVLVTGGLAGDGMRFQRTWVLSGDAVQSSLVTAVGLYGDHLSVGQGAAGGWEPQGPRGVITRASGHVLLEVDGQPALRWYRRHIGEHASGLPATGLLFPMGLELPDAGDDLLVRTVLAIDEIQESMTFAGEMPPGTRVHLMSAASAQLVAGARAATRMASEDMEIVGEAALGLLISGVGRRIVLGDRAGAELDAAVAELPGGAEPGGFYGYGGFAAFGGHASELHNQTFLATVISESDQPLTRPTAAAVSASTSLPQAMASASRRTPGQGVRAAPGRAREDDAAARDVGKVRVIELPAGLDESFDGDAVSAALAPVTVLDLARVERVTSYGVRAWLEVMEAAGERVNALFLARCAEPVVNQLMLIRAMIGSATLISFAAPYACKRCDHAFAHVLDCERDAEAIEAAQPPDVPCPRCGSRACFDDDPEAYRGLAAPHLARAVPVSVRRALAASEAQSVERAAGALEPMGAPAGDRRGLAALRGAGAGALATALVLGGLYWGMLRQPEPAASPLPDTGTTSQPATAGPAARDAGAGGVDTDTAAGTPAPAGRGALSLPPAWVDRAFTVQADEVLVVGKSGARGDAYSAAAAAYHDAVHELLVHMVPRLEGAPAHAYLRAHLDLMAGGRGDAEAVARMVARFEAHMGPDDLPERVEAFPVERDGLVSLAAAYRVSRPGFDRVLARYRAAERTLGMTVVTAFPLLAPALPGQGDLLVVEVDARSVAARAGVAPGEVIVRVGERYVSSLAEYAAALDEGWGQIRPRRFLEIEVRSGEGRGIRRLRKR